MSLVSTPVASYREQAILNHMPQVKMIASRLRRRCPPEVLLEDLVSAGVVGLLQACQKFDPRRQVKLGTLAEHRIRGAMLDYLRQLDPLPRALRQFQKKRETALANVAGSETRFSAEDVAATMGLPLNKYRRQLRESQAEDMISLDAPARDRVRGPEVPAAECQPIDRCVLAREIEDAIAQLPRSERIVMAARKAGECVREVARTLRVTEGRVSQIKNRAIHRLRIELGITCHPNG